VVLKKWSNNQTLSKIIKKNPKKSKKIQKNPKKTPVPPPVFKLLFPVLTELQRHRKQRKNPIELYPDLVVFITFSLFALMKVLYFVLKCVSQEPQVHSSAPGKQSKLALSVRTHLAVT
jgi:hypothetical protein